MNEYEALSARKAFLKNLIEDKKANLADVWKIEVYKHLLRAYGLPLKMLDVFKGDVDQDPEYQLQQDLQEYEEIKDITPCKLSITLQDLLIRPLDNPAFRRLMELMQECQRMDNVGLVIPVKNNGNWILHTFGAPDGELCGKAYIIIYANSRDTHDILVEPLKQFLESRKVKDA